MTEEQATKKKGLGLWWIAIGCGVLVIIAFVVMSAGLWFGGKMVKNVVEDFEDNPAKTVAKGIVMANPELEMVETDDDEGTITVRVKETGETATFDYSQIKEGKLSFESSEGTMSFDATGDEDGAVITMESGDETSKWGGGDTADWLPDYPNAENVQTAFTQEAGGILSGAYGFSTSDSIADVLAYYTGEFEADGYTVQENATSQNGEIQSAVMTARNEDSKRHAQVIVTAKDEATQVSVSYGSGE